jgi:co-chaperonin GroES (HSP10)
MMSVIDSIRPLKGKVLVHKMESGDKVTRGGIIVLDDDGKERGVRERWAQVWAVGPDIEEVKVGEWVLVKHGRWSRGIDVGTGESKTTIRQVEWPDAVLLVSDESLADHR